MSHKLAYGLHNLYKSVYLQYSFLFKFTVYGTSSSRSRHASLMFSSNGSLWEKNMEHLNYRSNKLTNSKFSMADKFFKYDAVHRLVFFIDKRKACILYQLNKLRLFQIFFIIFIDNFYRYLSFYIVVNSLICPILSHIR